MATTLSQRWKLAREAAGLGSNELDRAIGQGSGYTSPLEAGTKASPNLEIVARAATAMKVSPAWLAFGEGPMRSTETTGLDFPAGTLLLKLRKQPGLESWIEEHPASATVHELVRGIMAIESGRAAAYARSEDQRPHAGWGAFFKDLRAGKIDVVNVAHHASAADARAREVAELGGSPPKTIEIPSGKSRPAPRRAPAARPKSKR